MSETDLFKGTHPELGACYAAIDSLVNFVEPAVRASRIGARLAPYPSVEAAAAALKALGCDPDSIEVCRGAR
ncbi:MAG: hypothetical protein E6G92_07210 [Alphaproteobacteria bacterium]|nr:MAG: hypothetical protein E6G92_07210 [Alphaproteobacteria bacterium]